MSFQADPHTIRWRLHLQSPRAKVYEMLSTDAGRARFWAESANEENGVIHFVFPNQVTWDARILRADPPHTYAVQYYGNSAADRTEVIAGWVSVLMALKAAVDFGIDLRTHDPNRHWDNGFVEN